jgi:hypothetical protein
MMLSTRAIVLACAGLLIVSTVVTCAIERRHVRSRATEAATSPTASQVERPKPTRTNCDSLLAARNAMLNTTFDVAPADFYNGAPAEVSFADRREALFFRTRIRETVSQGPNFAGRYVVASWECGPQCQRHAVVDARTGTIISFGVESETGIQYSLRSRLLVTNPKKSISSTGDNDLSPLERALKYSRIPRAYYEVVEINASSFLNRLCVENSLEGDTF